MPKNEAWWDCQIKAIRDRDHDLEVFRGGDEGEACLPA
jgi:hypothetical protein